MIFVAAGLAREQKCRQRFAADGRSYTGTNRSAGNGSRASPRLHMREQRFIREMFERQK